MSEHHDLPDPRPAHRAAQEWFAGLVDNLRPGDFDRATPCTEFDVRQLCGHVVAAIDRATAIGSTGTFEGTSIEGPDVADDAWPEAFAAAFERELAVWGDDAVLGATVTVPWGQSPAAAALGVYTCELLVHGWDLAVATGQPVEADPALAAPMVERVRAFLPAGHRREAGIPFAEPVEPAPGAGPTEQLANWYGHARP